MINPLEPESESDGEPEPLGATPRSHSDLIRDIFIANVSDELRTPVSAMHGLVDLMRSDTRERDSACNWVMLDGITGQLLLMVDNLIDIAAISNDPRPLPVERVPTNMEGPVDRIVRGFNNQAGSRTSVLIPWIDPRLSGKCRVNIDPRRFHQILAALLQEFLRVKLTDRILTLDVTLNAYCDTLVVSLSSGDGQPLPLEGLAILRRCSSGLNVPRMNVTVCLAALNACQGAISFLDDHQVEILLPNVTVLNRNEAHIDVSCRIIIVGPTIPRSCGILSRYLDALRIPYSIVHAIREIPCNLNALVFCSADALPEFSRHFLGKVVVVAERHTFGAIPNGSYYDLDVIDIPWPFYPSNIFDILKECPEVSEGTVDDDEFSCSDKRMSVGGAPQVFPADILVVEDNNVIRRVTAKKLDKIFREVACVTSGAECLEKLNIPVPNRVILMDVEMPEMNGIELTRHIRSMEHSQGWRRSFIVAVTANSSAGDKQACLDCGMDDYICKPLSVERLLHVLQEHSVIPPSS
jgi:CheY-like chemotaxis protein